SDTHSPRFGPRHSRSLLGPPEMGPSGESRLTAGTRCSGIRSPASFAARGPAAAMSPPCPKQRDELSPPHELPSDEAHNLAHKRACASQRDIPAYVGSGSWLCGNSRASYAHRISRTNCVIIFRIARFFAPRPFFCEKREKRWTF